MSREPIVVTGTGVVASHAASRAAFALLLAAKEIPAPVSVTVDGRTFDMRPAADPTSVPARDARRLTRAALFALAASKEALEGAAFAPETIGVALGTGFGSLEATRLTLEALFERADYVSPTHFVGSVRHDAASATARLLSLRGPSVAASARRLSFEQAFGWALVQLRAGRARAMLAAGTDEVTPVFLRTLSRGWLRGRNVTRGEGAAALLLERESDARESRRPILARVRCSAEGVGSTDDLTRAVVRACTREGIAHDFDLLLAGDEALARDLVANGLRVRTVPEPVSSRTGVIAGGGALVAAAATLAVSGAIEHPAWRGRTALVAAREVDGSFFAYALEGAS